MKDYAKWFYESPAWRKCRKAYLSAHPICERCEKRGDIVPAKIIHHKKYITPQNINDSEITLSWSNLEAVCQDCHNIEHHEEDLSLSYEFGSDGQIRPPPPKKYGVARTNNRSKTSE